MKAEHTAQIRLLDLQGADTALAQLAHRRRSLPELAALAACEARAAALGNEIVDAETELADITGEQARLETDVDSVRARATRDEQRLQAGGLQPRELEGLQHEVVSLSRRQGNLEEELLEVMQARETTEAALGRLLEQRAALDDERAGLAARRDAAYVEIDGAAQQRTAQRQSIAVGIPADLLALYDKVRASAGGSGAAALRQRRCEGCRIELSGSELAAVRSAEPDVVMRCENCRRILIRTPESGL